jgi:hypothetical protein
MTRALSTAVLATFLAVLAQPGAPAGAQTTAKDVSAKSVEAWDTLKAYTAEKKNDAVAYGKKLVRESDAEIKKLEAKSSKVSGEAKAKYEQAIKDLKAKRAEAASKLAEMGKASGSAWDSAKNGFADAYKDLHDSFEKAAAELK